MSDPLEDRKMAAEKYIAVSVAYIRAHIEREISRAVFDTVNALPSRGDQYRDFMESFVRARIEEELKSHDL